MKSQAFKAQRHTQRHQRKEAKRREAKVTRPIVHQPLLWLGTHRPALAPRSFELMLCKLERQDAQRRKTDPAYHGIPPRAKRNCLVLFLNGRALNYRHVA